MVGDPVEGPGGLGVPLASARRCEALVCGACLLPCYSSVGSSAEDWQDEGDYSSGGGGNGNGGGGGGASNYNADSTLVLFACRHAFHARCLPEGACTLCLRANFAPF